MITEVPGILVGNHTDLEGSTGCTVVLCPPGTVGSGEVRGGAPGTRETDLLRPGMLVQEVHAVLLTGGSAFGLAAYGGVMRFLEERGIGVAVTAHDGLGRAIRPAHTDFDGDAIFALAHGDKDASTLEIQAAAADAVERAVVRAVRASSGTMGA